MPVLNRLKFRKGLNKALQSRDIAKSRSIAAEHEFKRAQHHMKNLPAIEGIVEERRQALLIRDGKSRQLHKLEMNKLHESVDLVNSNRKVDKFNNLRKEPVVGGLRLGRAIANILLGSNKVSTVAKNMGRVFSVAKKTEKKKPVVMSKSAGRLTFKKGTPSSGGPMMGRAARK